MKLNLLSFNVWGLNEDAALDLMKLYLMNHQPSLDIVALQEHKIQGQALPRLGERI